MNEIQDRIEQNVELVRRVVPQTQGRDTHVPTTLNRRSIENGFEDEEEDEEMVDSHRREGVRS